MATDFIAVDTVRSYDSEEAAETIQVGEPAIRIDGGGVRPLDVANDSDVEYVVGYARTGDHVERYETDYTSYGDLYTYEPASNKADEDWDDLVEHLIPVVDKDVVRHLSIEDETEPEPTFENNNTVGFVDFGNGPRLVPAGYTDSGGTQYGDGGAGDFVTVGEVDVQSPFKTIRGGYGEYIPVRYEE